MAPAFTIRTGRPDELETVRAIDDDACRLYERAGMKVELAPEDPYAVAETVSWRRSLERGDAFIAEDASGAPIGFAALELVDGAPYLEQLSVRLESMGQGVGRALLGCALEWAGARGDTLWLNTYAHVPWNRPFYEKEGFTVVPSDAWAPEMSALIAAQRAALPAPDERIVMRRVLR
jgi:GNAT superfamily N-acetyltransferase